MVTTYCLINCDGDIFKINFKKNKITAQALLKNGEGKIIFDVSKFSIIQYLHSGITLKGLLEKSKQIEFYDFATRSISTINKMNVGNLSCGDDLYNDLSSDMILSFPKRIELAVRASHIDSEYAKMLELVRQYFYLREKLEFLSLTFSKKKIEITHSCYQAMIDLRHFLIESEIPILFASERDIKFLNVDKLDLKKECGLCLKKIGSKDLFELTNIETNYLVYHLSDLVADLNKRPRFWNKATKMEYLKNYGDHYIPFKRDLIINDILN